MATNPWQPLPWWKIVLVFGLTNVAMQLVGVALREGLGLGFVTPAGGAAGGALLGLFGVQALARRSRAAAVVEPEPPASWLLTVSVLPPQGWSGTLPQRETTHVVEARSVKIVRWGRSHYGAVLTLDEIASVAPSDSTVFDERGRR